MCPARGFRATVALLGVAVVAGFRPTLPPQRSRALVRRGAASRSAESIAAVDTVLQRLLAVCDALQQPPSSEPAHPIPLVSQVDGSVRAAASRVHGEGLFAARRLAIGTVATLYPVHAVGVDGLLRDDEAHEICFSADAAHFANASASADYKQYVALRGSTAAGDEGAPRAPFAAARVEQMFVNANPNRRRRVDDGGDGEAAAGGGAWLGHLVNDGAAMFGGDTSDGAIEAYSVASSAARNVVAVPLGGAAPLVALVTTAEVPSGAELFATYEYRYWLGRAGVTPPPPTPLVRALDVAAEARAAEGAATVEATFGDELIALRAILEQAYEYDDM